MKKLLIIPWLLTILWVMLGAVYIPVYLWYIIPIDWVKLISLPVMITMAIGLPFLMFGLYMTWWEWMFDSKGCHGGQDEYGYI